MRNRHAAASCLALSHHPAVSCSGVSHATLPWNASSPRMSLAFNVEFVDPEYYKATLGDKARSKDQTFVRLMGDDMLPDG